MNKWMNEWMNEWMAKLYYRYRPTGSVPLPHDVIDDSMPIPRNIETSADVWPWVGVSTCKQIKTQLFIQSALNVGLLNL